MSEDKAREMLVQRGLGAVLANMGAGKIGPGAGKPPEKKPPTTPPKVDTPKPNPEVDEEPEEKSPEEFTEWDESKEETRPTSDVNNKNTVSQRKDNNDKKEVENEKVAAIPENIGAIHRGVGAVLATMSSRNLGGNRPGDDRNFGGNRPGDDRNLGGNRTGDDRNLGGNRSGDRNHGGNRSGDRNLGGNRSGGDLNSSNKGNMPQRQQQRNQGFNMNSSREFTGWDMHSGSGANSEPLSARSSNNQRMSNYNKGECPGSSGPRGGYNPDPLNSHPTHEDSGDRGGGYKRDAPQDHPEDNKKQKQDDDDYGYSDKNMWNDNMDCEDEDEDNDRIDDENKKLAEEYGGNFITVRPIKDQPGKLGYYCELCYAEMNAKKSLELHCGGMKHLKKLMRVKENDLH